MNYQIEYLPITKDHFRALTTRQCRIVLEAVIKQLTNDPNIKTKNRFPMRSNSMASWELRLGNLRIYYDIEDTSEPTVYILAIGVKEGNQVRIGGDLINL